MHLPLISVRMVAAGLVVLGLAGVGVAAGFWLAGRGSAARPGPWAGFAAGAVVFGAVWARSSVRHPWRNCRRCSPRRKRGQQRPASG